MNHVQIGALLKQALAESGRTSWELARRAAVRLESVQGLLEGAGTVPIRDVVEISDALDLEVTVVPSRLTRRGIGPVPSTVDQALERLHQTQLDLPPGTTPQVADFLVHQRRLLDQLEAFTRSGAYGGLLAKVRTTTRADPPHWTAQWLVTHMPELNGAPIELMRTDEDIARLAEQIIKLALEAAP